jgi:alkylhydroperoxidase family enzyme
VHGGPFDPCWSERESLVFALADELHHDSDVSDDLYRALQVHWTPQQIIELLATAGWYRTISYLANGPRVEFEPWARRFPKRPDEGEEVAR